MASLDYAQDLIELFKEHTNEYVLIVVQPGKKKDKALVFYNVQQASSAKLVGETLQYVSEKVLQTPPGSADNIKEDPDKNPK